jgi:glycosyltransferase involved in cell wall biosynthesis
VIPVTIIIPTFNRSDKISETFHALSQQDFIDFKVIVVDDGSSEENVEKIRQLISSLPFPAKLICQKNAGASAATNNGVQAAEDGIIILLDDDIIPASDTIRRHVEFHKENTGSILSGSANTDTQRTITDVQRYKFYMEQEWLKVRPLSEKLSEITFSNFVITTANMSFPRTIFLELGGFDLTLRDGYDVDFGFRALLRNIPVYFDRSIQSIHNDQISLRYYARRQKAYITSKKIILERNPELKKKTGNDFEIRVPFLKSILYSILRTSFFVRFFESSTFSFLFPRRLRYAIYGSTIAALSTTT